MTEIKTGLICRTLTTYQLKDPKENRWACASFGRGTKLQILIILKSIWSPIQRNSMDTRLHVKSRYLFLLKLLLHQFVVLQQGHNGVGQTRYEAQIQELRYHVYKKNRYIQYTVSSVIQDRNDPQERPRSTSRSSTYEYHKSWFLRNTPFIGIQELIKS